MIWHLEDAKTRTLEARAAVAQPFWLRVQAASSRAGPKNIEQMCSSLTLPAEHRTPTRSGGDM